MIPLNMKRRDFIYTLNEQDIKVEMTIMHFDNDNDNEDNYLVLFRPHVVMVYNNQALMVSHVSIDIINNEERWINQDGSTRVIEISAEDVDPKFRNRLYAEILLD